MRRRDRLKGNTGTERGEIKYKILVFFLIIAALMGLVSIESYTGYFSQAVNASAGTITTVVIQQTQETGNWAGYAGIFSINLNSVAPISSNATGGEVTNLSLEFDCFGTTGNDVYVSPVWYTDLELGGVFTNATPAEVDAFIGIDPSNPMSATNTFTQNISFQLGPYSITSLGTYTKQNDSSGTDFAVAGVKDANGTIFFATVVNDTDLIQGYDDGYYNYQVMIPVPLNQSNITYYFFGDPLSDPFGNCIAYVNVTGYRNRVFYEDGTPINISFTGIGSGSLLSANFSVIDSNYVEGSEVVTEDSNGYYHIYYEISSDNTRANGPYDIPIAINGQVNNTVKIYLYNGEPGLSARWDPGIVLKASACAAGNPASDYFLENGTCPTINYLTQLEGLDAIFADREVGGSATEFICTDETDSDKTYSGSLGGADGADCADKDCASIVYGQPPANSSTKTRPFWTCANTTVGWRDDPPLNLGVLSCDTVSNLCTGALVGNNYGTTYFFYTYKVAPGGNLSIRFQQDSGLNGKDVQFKLTDSINPELNDYVDTSGYKILNETASTGFSKDDSFSSDFAFYVTDEDYEQTILDFVYKIPVRSGAADANHSALLSRVVADAASDYYELLINFTVSSIGPKFEHDVSCSDTCTGSGPNECDNDLDYLYNCEDDDCDTYQGGSLSYQICAYQNESRYAQENNTCADNFDNDADGQTDCVWTGTGGGTADTDCNGTYMVNMSQYLSGNIGADNGTCELSTELTCWDVFDNDRDRQYDCMLESINGYSNIEYLASPSVPKITYTGGTGTANYPDAEYDCAGYCQGISVNNSIENGTECLDGMDNDWDFYNIGTTTRNTTGGGVDCRMIYYDESCNMTYTSPGSDMCELIHEQTCNDGFDNDRDGELDCTASSTGSVETNPSYQYSTSGSNTAHGEYDCQSTCNVSANYENNSVKCLDNKDNDLDYWTITGWTGTQYTATNNYYEGGMDCRYNPYHWDGNLNNDLYPDKQCDNVDMGGWLCELGHETSCADGYDNDRDDHYNKGGNRSADSGGYDCDDYDCSGNAVCPSVETGTQCLDHIDNDLDRYDHNITDYLLDSMRIVNASGGIDCIYYANGYMPNQNWPAGVTAYDSYKYDVDCNGTLVDGVHACELIDELTCNDGFDNDQDYYISQIQNAGWSSASYEAYFGGGSYAEDADCNDYSCSGDASCPSDEANSQCQYGNCRSAKNWCLDGVDNDLDNYLSDGLTSNTADGAGIDCQWKTQNYDADCNNTLINDSGYVGKCTIGWEYNCSDNVDNDQDDGFEVSAGYSTGVDCDDYNCHDALSSGTISCTGSVLAVETNCSDGIDNDLDAYTWNGSAYNANPLTGADCSDLDCYGKIGPSGVACGNEDAITTCIDYDSNYYAVDNEEDGAANCYDSGCYHQDFNIRYCPSIENITIDACADELDNEIYYQDANIARTGANSLKYYNDDKNLTLHPGDTDCADSDCVGEITYSGGSYVICSAVSTIATESNCGDGLDDDMDGETDCDDSDCSGDALCGTNPGNNIAACSGSGCTIAGYLDYGDEDAKNSTLSNIGSGTVDLIYTQYIKRGSNMTWLFYDDSVTTSIYLQAGTASDPLPSEFNSSTQPYFEFGEDTSSFIHYMTPDGGFLEAASFAGSFNVGIGMELPADDEIIVNSGTTGYAYDVKTIKNGDSQTETIRTYVIEDVAPEKPDYVLTDASVPITNSLRRIRDDGTVYRLRSTDTVLVYVNASDNTSYNADSTFNTGIESVEFKNSVGGAYQDGGNDGIYLLSYSDGAGTVYSRAIDGVGNVGDESAQAIEVITLPRQDTTVYCTASNCAESYPVKTHYYYDPIPLGLNFTSDVAGFSDNATGCVVKAESTNGIVTLGSVPMTVSTDGKTAICSGEISIKTLADDFYYLTVEVVDNNGNSATSGIGPNNDGLAKDHFWKCVNIKTNDGWTCATPSEIQSPIDTTAISCIPNPVGNGSSTVCTANVTGRQDIQTVLANVTNSVGTIIPQSVFCSGTDRDKICNFTYSQTNYGGGYNALWWADDIENNSNIDSINFTVTGGELPPSGVCGQWTVNSSGDFLVTYNSSADVCRQSAGPCDTAEYCTGASVYCPRDDFNSSADVCRASAGPCDIEETCTGSSAACPVDAFNATGTVVNQSDCSDLDEACKYFGFVDNTCDGSGNIVFGNCNTVVSYNASGTVINSTNCDYLDVACTNYYEANTTCDGLGGIIHRNCSTEFNYVAEGTYVNSTNCDSYDWECRNYSTVNNTCNGLGGITYPSCDVYVSDDGSTMCNFSFGVDYGCPFGTDLGDDVYNQTVRRYCGINTGECDGALDYLNDWQVFDDCRPDQEICVDNDSTCNDIIPPSLPVSNIVNRSIVTSSTLYKILNVTFDETVNSVFSVNGDRYRTLCTGCVSALKNVSMVSYGNKTLRIKAIDPTGNTKTIINEFEFVLDTDNDGLPDVVLIDTNNDTIPDSNDLDDDNDIISDFDDSLNGFVVNVATNIARLNVTVNESDNLSQNLNATINVTFKEENDPVVEFTFTFDPTDNDTRLNMAEIFIEKQEPSAQFGSIVMSGLNLEGQGRTKSVYMDRLTNHSSICVRDEELSSVSQISSGCNESSEIFIDCPSTSGTYKCYNHTTSSGQRQWRITGLVHTAVLEFCTENWTCTDWNECNGVYQSRNCTDLELCGTDFDKPDTRQACTLPEEEEAPPVEEGIGNIGGIAGIPAEEAEVEEEAEKEVEEEAEGEVEAEEQKPTEMVKKSIFDVEKLLKIVPLWVFIPIAALVFLSYLAIALAVPSFPRIFYPKVNMAQMLKPGPNTFKMGNLAETNISINFGTDQLLNNTLITGGNKASMTTAAKNIAEGVLLKGVPVTVVDTNSRWQGIFSESADKGIMNLFKSDKGFKGDMNFVDGPKEDIDIGSKKGEVQLLNASELDSAGKEKFMMKLIDHLLKKKMKPSKSLKQMVVFDDINALLPRNGGKGEGLKRLQEAVVKLKKKGIGIVTVSETIGDLSEGTVGNFKTKIQTKTTKSKDLAGVKKIGERYLQTLVKSQPGQGMIQQTGVNGNKPFFADLKPSLKGRTVNAKIQKKMLDAFNKIKEKLGTESREINMKMDDIKDRILKGRSTQAINQMEKIVKSAKK